ncbi:MAG: YeeE/YedE thiosulfate transporter family protein [Mycobacterium sp.]|nr:YeeE/YedE thiosulfate transporter family protein [Mycobacterium sp.]
MHVTAPLWVGFLIGLAFGVPAELWGIGNPETIIRTARLVDRLLMGCFAYVTAVGAVLLYGLYALGVSMHFSPKPLYIFGVTLGGLLFGIGAAVGGYFPGTEWIALGEARRDALYAIPGGLLGAAAWTILYQTPVGRWLVTTADYGNLVVTGDITRIHPVATLAAAVCYAAVALSALYFLPRYKGGKHSCFRHLGHCAPDDHDRAMARDTAAYLAEGAVDPIGPPTFSRFQRLAGREVPAGNFYGKPIGVVGFIVAVVVVSAIFLHQIFGQSTTYSWLVGKLFLTDFSYTEKVSASIGWEPFTDVGLLFGGLVSAVFISRRFTAFHPVIPPSWRNRFGHSMFKRAVGSFGGSFLVLFGARMADGCTSGHTLSGGVQLAASAWLFTAAMVVALLVTARLLYRDASWLTYPTGSVSAKPTIDAT